MRYASLFFGLLLVMGVRAQAPAVPPAQPARPIYTALRTDVPPELREGRTFVPVSVIAREFGATVTWLPATQEVRIVRPNAAEIRLTIGSRTAKVGDQTATLDVAPYITDGRTMVPLRFIAESYQIPVSYRAETADVLLQRDNKLYVLPFASTRAGITIDDPQPGELVRNPVRVQGVANVFEGALIIEVQDNQGRVLGRTTATAGMGGFYAYSAPIYYNLPSEDSINGRIVVYAESPQGNHKILARASVNVVIASTL